MSALSGLGIGVAASLIAAWVLAGFKSKQLYLVIPRLFAFSALTDKGTIIEMQVFNKGRSSEEDVHIDLPPNITYELIAADLSNATVDKFAVVLPRIPPLSEASVIVLAEAKIEPSSTNIKISSKSTKGYVLKKVGDVPPNFGRFIAGVMAFIAVAALLLSSESIWTSYKHWRSADQIANLTNLGWSDFDGFFSSDMRDSYKRGEFPFHLLSAAADGKKLILVFDIANKTAMVAKITAFFQCANGKRLELCGDELKGDTNVINQPLDPLQSARLTIAADLSQLPSIEVAYVQVSIDVGTSPDNELVMAKFHPLKNPESLAVLKLLQQAPAK